MSRNMNFFFFFSNKFVRGTRPTFLCANTTSIILVKLSLLTGSSSREQLNHSEIFEPKSETPTVGCFFVFIFALIVYFYVASCCFACLVPGNTAVYTQLLLAGADLEKQNGQKPSRGMVNRDRRTNAALVLPSGLPPATPCPR